MSDSICKYCGDHLEPSRSTDAEGNVFYYDCENDICEEKRKQDYERLAEITKDAPSYDELERKYLSLMSDLLLYGDHYEDCAIHKRKDCDCGLKELRHRTQIEQTIFNNRKKQKLGWYK